MIRIMRPALWAPAVALALMLMSSSITFAGTSNKWRIQVSEGANSDGTILFRVTPKGGTPMDVAVTIKDGRRENGVAHDIRDAFKAALDKKKFTVEVDDGEDVLVKKKGGTPDFELVLVESTVKSVRINLDKE